jgi:polar amino acid transport system substrate-binding protein
MASDGKTRLIESFPGGWPLTVYISVTTRKGSGFACAITHALNAQIASCTYAQMLRRWNLISEATLNPKRTRQDLPRTEGNYSALLP